MLKGIKAFYDFSGIDYKNKQIQNPTNKHSMVNYLLFFEYCESIVYAQGTNFRGFCCLMKPGKFKSNKIELVHTLSVPVFKTTN
jgi:hypothetical protein